ncbi:protein-glutamine gamma-glutamyltransferase 4-like isoform X2 [Sceloporus undulatus]|uniref:protein-glutamine gamma-glutamyltransferase 4-like isoform X2 n=1 Tax=Sceloporus undulatus TaxID=8520 RepID=UPI001C4D3819|nr:protein-glutamine gamma-glutamyltransferase 4-like isoform X2 [Sceloporus undulatus]
MSNTAGNLLQAVGVNFLIEENTRLHHTNEYENGCLIVRRGQEFKLRVTFSRELNDNDEVTLVLKIGENEDESNDAYLYLNTRSGTNDEPWQAKIFETNREECVIVVTSPADAIVGKYFLNVVTEAGPFSPTNNCVYVLFNPWCKADSVFMPEEDKKAEYVLNENGCLYTMGHTVQIYPTLWNYGQFEKDILDCCMYLLDESQLKPNERRDPVKISRAMSGLVNMEKDNGVLQGRWKEPYQGGTSPLHWTGSVPILQTYYRTKRTVSYAQCWVFSGVITTVMRCLGIPTRSVTTYDCAHDTEENLTIDQYFDEIGNILPHSDFIWTFHVWNEVWMKRADLPEGFDGWQVIDGTPPEKSKGIVQCGPASVKAIKQGEVGHGYDTKYVFSEVNADQVWWRRKNVNGEEKFIKCNTDTEYIGRNITTKAVGKLECEDITDQYKFPEGSEEERNAMKTAMFYVKSPIAASYPTSFKRDFELRVQQEKTLWPGQPIDLNIVVESKFAGAWTVDLYASCNLESYTGRLEANLATVHQTIKTVGKTAVPIPLKVAADVYMNKLTSSEDELLIKVNIFADIQESKQNLAKQVTLTFQTPALELKLPEKAKLNETLRGEVIFKNTLSIPLENCKLCVEGPGIYPAKNFNQRDVQPGEIATFKIECIPRKIGNKTIIAKLNSTQVKGIDTSKSIKITA